MGNSADDYKNFQSLKREARKRFSSDRTMDDLASTAEDLSLRDKMPFKAALKVLSGMTRTAYGSPKPDQ